MTAIISTDKLCKQYPGARGPLAVSAITLTVAPGEIFSLLGRNGAGKTTLLALLGGLFPPTSGDALIAGHSVTRAPLAVKRLIGVVPQEIALYPQLSGRQNLRYFGQLYGLQGSALERAVVDTLAVVGMDDMAEQKVNRCSNGMKRRLNIAAALLHHPPLLFMDEPTVGLDPDSRRRILDLIVRLRKEQGVTVVCATHHMEEAQELSDRVAIMHQGRIIALGSPGDLIRNIHAPDTVRLRVAGAADPAGALDALRRIGVEQATAQDRVVTLKLSDAAKLLPGILSSLHGFGVEILSLTVTPPGLETVFLHLTGEQIEAEP